MFLCTMAYSSYIQWPIALIYLESRNPKWLPYDLFCIRITILSSSIQPSSSRMFVGQINSKCTFMSDKDTS